MILPQICFPQSMSWSATFSLAHSAAIPLLFPLPEILPLDLHMVYFLTFFRSLLRCLLVREAIIYKKPPYSSIPGIPFPWSCFTFSTGLITTRYVFVICLLPLDDDLYKGRRLYCILSTNSTWFVVVS